MKTNFCVWKMRCKVGEGNAGRIKGTEERERIYAFVYVIGS